MKKTVSLLLAIAMLFSMGTAVFAADAPQQDYPQKFWDVPKGHWAFECIAELVDKGVLEGYEDGSFRPDNTVTRAEWAKIMVLAAGLPVNDNNVYFTDMSNHWANTYVNAAKDYLAAYTDGSFKPDQAAVREDVTVSMVKLKGYDINSVDYSYLSQFTDTNSISNSLKAYVAVAVEKGLISGFEDNTFRGQNTLTRAEAATLLWRAFQYGNDNKVVNTPDTPIATPYIAVTNAPVQASQPTQNPTANPTQKPTVNPTAKPMPEPTATPEPTPEPTPKPYMIDTIVKANIDSMYLYTQDESGNIYYVTDEKIYKTNIAEKSQEEIFDAANLTIDTEEMTLSDFSIESICCNPNNDSLLMQGKYNTVNAVGHPSSDYLYEIKSGEATALTDGFYDQVVAVLTNGDIAGNGCLYDGTTYDRTGYYEIDKAYNYSCDVYNIIEQGNELYYCGSFTYSSTSVGSFRKYDFANTERLWNFNHELAAGINRDKVFLIKDNGVEIYNYSGKVLQEITASDLEIADRKTFDSEHVQKKLMITSDEDIIFYDTAADSFRIISKNN